METSSGQPARTLRASRVAGGRFSIAVRINYQVAPVEESRRRTPVERNQSGLKVDQLVAQLVVTELHSSSGFAAEFDCLLLDAIKLFRQPGIKTEGSRSTGRLFCEDL